MKKIMMTMTVLIGMTAGAMMFSAFTTLKQNSKAESSQIQMNNDNWKRIRENVAYCDADTDQCIGRGDIWVNTDTHQAKIRIGDRYEYDLTEYSRNPAYNYRFWHGIDKTYYYVYINIRF